MRVYEYVVYTPYRTRPTVDRPALYFSGCIVSSTLYKYFYLCFYGFKCSLWTLRAQGGD